MCAAPVLSVLQRDPVMIPLTVRQALMAVKT